MAMRSFVLDLLQDYSKKGPFLVEKQGKQDTNKHIISLFRETRQRQSQQRPSILQVKIIVRNSSFR